MNSFDVFRDVEAVEEPPTISSTAKLVASSTSTDYPAHIVPQPSAPALEELPLIKMERNCLPMRNKDPPSYEDVMAAE